MIGLGVVLTINNTRMRSTTQMFSFLRAFYSGVWIKYEEGG